MTRSLCSLPSICRITLLTDPSDLYKAFDTHCSAAAPCTNALQWCCQSRSYLSCNFLQLLFCKWVTAVTWLQVPLTQGGPCNCFTPQEPIYQNSLLFCWVGGVQEPPSSSSPLFHCLELLFKKGIAQKWVTPKVTVSKERLRKKKKKLLPSLCPMQYPRVKVLHLSWTLLPWATKTERTDCV